VSQANLSINSLRPFHKM